MATVSFTDIKKRFGRTDVIHGVSTAIADGEFIVIVGPSGCGKSTLLRMVAGLESVSDGEVRSVACALMNSSRWTAISRWCSRTYALYPHMSVRDNMGFGLEDC